MKTFKYITSKYNFKDLVSQVFEVNNIENLHNNRRDLLTNQRLDLYTESSTKFHDLFYSKLKDDWIEFYECYDNFIHTEVVKLFDEPFHYQKWPTFRVHIPNDQAVHTWHSDGDALHKHPKGEVNFFLPLTKCYGTNTVWVESEPWKLDFQPLEGDFGDYWKFDGNQCMHGNKPNKTNLTRVSFDFRVIPLSKYDSSWNSDSPTSHTKFVVGEYYKELQK